MIKLSFLGDIMCLKAQNDAVMKKHGEYRYDGVSVWFGTSVEGF